MSPQEIRLRRQYNQKLLTPDFTKPEDVVSSMAAMQAQEYAMAKWAIGLRMKNSQDSDIEKAFDEGRILRTHILRPTWHFVAQEDIRWMLDIAAPRVTTGNGFMYRKYELDSKLFNKCNGVMEKLLRDHNHLTRDAIKQEFAKNGIEGDGVRISLIMMQAELEGIVCSGPRQGNQFTYALIDERAPKAKRLSREEALREICYRYFKTRGPASVKDFTVWSGLTVKEAKEGIALTGDAFEKTIVDGIDYYYPPEMPVTKSQVSFLMPDYDEYGIAYKNRGAMDNPVIAEKKTIFDRVVIVDGMIAGSWKRTLAKESILLGLQLFGSHKPADKAIVSAIEKYGKFLGKKVELI